MTKNCLLRLSLTVLVLNITLACSVSAPLIQPTPTATVQPADVYLDLRSSLFETNPHDIGIEPNVEMPNVWGVMMEFWTPNTLVTSVSLADGTTSLYFGNGGGVIGGGEHQQVADVTKQLVVLSESFYRKMTPTEEYPLPAQGKVQFYILTYSEGAYSVIIDEDEVTYEESEFSPLFFAANDVISQVRLVSATEHP